MLNPVAQKWVDALRSGKYRQCRNQLRSDDREAYCCLGVLAELYVEVFGADIIEREQENLFHPAP